MGFRFGARGPVCVGVLTQGRKDAKRFWARLYCDAAATWPVKAVAWRVHTPALVS